MAEYKDLRHDFEGYIRRHEQDPFAHAPMRDKFEVELLGDAVLVGNRLTSLERWQQRIIGGLGMLSLLIAGGGLTIVIELLRK